MTHSYNTHCLYGHKVEHKAGHRLDTGWTGAIVWEQMMLGPDVVT